MYKVLENKNGGIDVRYFQNKWNVIEYLKKIFTENENNIHYYYKDYKENNIVTIDNNIYVKWIGNVSNPYKNKDYELFSLIHNNLWIKSKVC